MVSKLPLTFPFIFGGDAPTSEIVTFTDKDLSIYYGAGLGSSFDVRCSRWDCDNYNIIVEAWLTKSQLNALMNNTRPGAVKELKRVIFSPKFYDSSWQGYNTILIKPTVGTSLYHMRGKEKIIYCKNISSSPLPGDSLWLNCKIEGAISGQVI